MKPTTTSRVYDVLKACGDFRTARQIKVQLGENINRVSAALYHLRAHKAVDFVEAPETLWWFATPESDNRLFKKKGITERVVTRPRKKKVIKTEQTRRRMSRRYKI